MRERLLQVGVLLITVSLLGASVGVVGASAYPLESSGEPGVETNTTTTSTTSTTAIPPTGDADWELLINDTSDTDQGADFDKIYVNQTETQIYFKFEYYENISDKNDINTAVFIDSDQDTNTGYNGTNTVGSIDYYMDGIGADYVSIMGQEGPVVAEWNRSFGGWEGLEPLAYSDVDYEQNTSIMGINRSTVDNPETYDVLFGEAAISSGEQFDYAPNVGDGHLTITQNPQEPPTNATVSLEPDSLQVPPNETTTTNISIENTDQIGAYAFSASLDNDSSAQITDVQLGGDPGQSSTDISESGQQVEVQAALADVDVADGAPIATLSIRGSVAGATNLTVNVSDASDLEGNPYPFDSRTTTVPVTVQAGPGDVTGNGDAATDPDGDGIYEDVNGDGSVTVTDVQALFAAVSEGSIQSDETAFDYNGDGAVTVTDVQALFSQIV
ncbi:dockerin type I domain-containing protein [Halorubrum kocurii]|uniref:dockerin type I domain-containing protein n=1 Tax=Halorubrum kocurii TaxID=478441 RepID=UPI0012691BCE|nr:dockerin type I domain-containing protein [Halorubrum kocurii]